ncbi:MAG: RsmD family RNA methyltransferase [Pirellulales bacterium]
MPRPGRSEPDRRRRRGAPARDEDPTVAASPRSSGRKRAPSGEDPTVAASPRSSGRKRALSGEDPTVAASPPRIIGGDLRRRRLAFVPDPRTRPMKDRVRESLFDLVGTTVRGTLAIDCFAGSGALGFEALSRGAARALFGERHFPTADRLRVSAAELGVTDRVEVRPGDVLLWARRPPPIPTSTPWLVFVSPPWEMFTSRRDDLMALVAMFQGAAPPASLIVVESDTTFDPAGLPSPDDWTARAVPPAVLHFFHRPNT